MTAQHVKPSTWLEPWQWQLLVLSTLVKLLLIPTYHSTDFEVHRNWLAITNTLPLSQWYFDETSKWTLDYPPFFAYLSYALSVPASLWDPRIVALKDGLEYDGLSCKVFMRLSVLFTELTFASALFALSKKRWKDDQSHAILPSWSVAALLLHPGLLFVDHIHFQYNGFLYGILLWSLWAAREQRPLLCAFLFSTLLNFKHIYVYVAPAYFVYLLQTYVIQSTTGKHASNVQLSEIGERLFTLGTITLLPFVLSLTPLFLSGLTASAPAGPIGIVKQMVSRLFPFSRGLNHAYWAANVWALYTFADRALVKVMHVKSQYGNATRGIIGDTNFDVLPSISAGHCFLLTMTFSALLCTRLWQRPTYLTFVESIALFGLTSFLFGFHVHEKAILIALLPLTLLSHTSFRMMRKTYVLSVAGIVGLFPLLYEARELPIKLLYTAAWLLLVPLSSTFGMRFTSSASASVSLNAPTNWDLLVHFAEDAYVAGFVVLVAFVELVHPFLSSSKRGTFDNVLDSVSNVAGSAVEAVSSAAMPIAGSAQSTGLLSVASSAASQAASAAASAFLATSTTNVGQVQTALQHDRIPAVVNGAASMQFLPLMLTSVYCAVGVVWVYTCLAAYFLLHTSDDQHAANDNNATSATNRSKSARAKTS